MTNEELFALVRKNPISVGCGVLSLLLAGTIYWRSDAGPEKEEELVKKSDEGQRFAANLKNAGSLQEQYDAVVAANKAIDARIVRYSRLGVNLQYFYKLESETGVKLTSDPRISQPVAKKDPKAAYVAVPCNLAVQGSLPQLLNFLRRLENGTHYCRILTITLGGPADRNAPLSLTINLELLGLP
ncbi:MAG: hypothetical protein NTV51_16460 [Verrucomicrobia bacterium]|nr:hypothetical protein [Verrucomicrobiota bacterium]